MNHGIVIATWRYMTLLAVTALSPAVGGCLLPPPIEEVAQPDNQAPRIIPDSLSPWPVEGPTQLSVECDRYAFSATLTDPDLSDALYWRVFVDYKHDPNPGDAEEGKEITPREERFPIQFTISPEDTRFGSTLETPHLIELLVSDRPFFKDERPLRGRAVPADALTDSVIWTVILTAEALPCEQL